MFWFYDFYDAILSFMDAGGPVLWMIGAFIFVMWSLILERAWYLSITHRKISEAEVDRWQARTDIQSWFAHRIREAIISRVNLAVDQNMQLIATLVTLCPLLGLLGTVTGMIEVFNVLAISGGGDVRSMAGGVSKATIPTMAGMVAALSGVFTNIWLKRRVESEKEYLQDHLNLEY